MVHEFSCSTGMWDLLRPVIKPISPALAGGFFTTEPPRKKYDQCVKDHFCFWHVENMGGGGDEESWHEGRGEGLDMGVTREVGFHGHGPEKRLEVQDQGID